MLKEKCIKADDYYCEYHGHRIAHLDKVEQHLRSRHSGALIYLAGDSSLDNKYWFNDKEPAVNGMEDILTPPRSIRDIAHCMNKEIVARGLGSVLSTLNCSIEESTIGSRARCNLLPQDMFIRDSISSNDVLVVSLGGNDVALKPSPCTALSMILLLCCSSTGCLDSLGCGCSIPVDDPCMGALCGCWSNCLAFPCGLGYFLHLFGTRLEAVVRNMISKKKPKLVVVCTIYYLDEDATAQSWANTTLSLLGYNRNPAKLQAAIKQIYRLATSKISIQGTKVVAVPLFESLDGKDTRDYNNRVEPSAVGGEKMARQLLDAILNADSTLAATDVAIDISAPPIQREAL